MMMKEKMSSSGISNNPPKEFIEYLHNLLDEIIVNKESFDKYKKWLKKYCDEYDINYPHIESEIEDFIELINEYNNNSNKIVRKSLDKSGTSLFLKLKQVEQLLTKYKNIHSSENKVDISVNDVQRKYDWEDAKIENTADSYQEFIDTYKTGKFIPSATKKLRKLEHVELVIEEYGTEEYDYKDSKTENTINQKNKENKRSVSDYFAIAFIVLLFLGVIISESVNESLGLTIAIIGIAGASIIGFVGFDKKSHGK